MRRLLMVAAFGTALVVAGCASHPRVVGGPNDPAPQKLVVENIRDVVPTGIDWPADVNELNYRVDFTSGAHQKIAVADDDPVYVRLFKLPVWSGPYSIRVSTLVQGQGDDWSVYYPRLTFLDEHFKVVRASKQSDFRLRGDRSSSGSLTATLFGNEGNAAEERYVAIFEEPRKSLEEQLSLFKTPGGDSLVLPWQIKIFHAIWMVSLARDEPPQRLRAASAGLVDINFARYKPRKVGE